MPDLTGFGILPSYFAHPYFSSLSQPSCYSNKLPRRITCSSRDIRALDHLTISGKLVLAAQPSSLTTPHYTLPLACKTLSVKAKARTSTLNPSSPTCRLAFLRLPGCHGAVVVSSPHCAACLRHSNQTVIGQQVFLIEVGLSKPADLRPVQFSSETRLRPVEYVASLLALFWH